MRTLPLLVALCCSVILSGAALAQSSPAESGDLETGTLTGRVTEAGTGQLLPGATVRLKDTTLGAATDAFGTFTIRSVPAGPVTLVASFVGYEDAEVGTTVEAGQTTYVEIALTEDTRQLAEVVVRSEKFVRNLQDTQTSVNVVDGAQLESIPVRDWEDATRLVGNVSTSGNGVFTIRGIPNSGFGGGSGPTAALYVDGVQQGRFGTFRTIRGAWDLEAVEVFRGPQSTLSGRNSLAGAIYLRSAAPSFEYGAAARVRGGTNDALEGAFMVTGPIIADQLAFRISGEVGTEDEGFSYATIDSDDDDFDRTTRVDQRNLKTRLLFTPKALPGFSVLAGYTYAFDRPANPLVTAVTDAEGELDFSDRESQNPIAFFDETTHHSVSVEASYEVTPALTLTALSSYLTLDFFIDGLRYQSDDPDIFVPVSQRSDTDETTFTQELRANYETERTRAVFGGYYGRFNSNRLRNDAGDVFALARQPLEDLIGSSVPPFGILYDAFNDEVFETDNYAVFGEVNHEVVPGLTLTAGLRYDRESFENTSTVTSAVVNFEGTPAPVVRFEPLIESLIIAEVASEDEAASTTFDAWLPKAGVTYDLTRDASVGFTFQRGYRAGGAFFVIGERDVNEFDPEFTSNYELSFRSRWLDGRLIANANVFYTDWSEQQISVPATNPNFNLTINAGASTLYGGELELRAIPTRRLTLYGSLGLTDSEFDEFIRTESVRDQQTRDAVDVRRNLAGLSFPGAPETTLALGAIYDRGSGPFAAVNFSYTGENYALVGTQPGDQALIENPSLTIENDPLLRAGDYVMLDAQLGYALRVQGTRVRLTGFARNLLDVVVTDRRFYNAFGGIDGEIVTPRVMGVSLDIAL
ncbi:MAG: TonB-dependent receptor [Bacteroidota bacterium]